MDDKAVIRLLVIFIEGDGSRQLHHDFQKVS
jgi:hypothetical protein